MANSYRFGGVVENPEAAIDDGKLWLYTIDIKHWWHAFGILASVALHRFPHAPDVVALRGHRSSCAPTAARAGSTPTASPRPTAR